MKHTMTISGGGNDWLKEDWLKEEGRMKETKFSLIMVGIIFT